MTLTGSLTYFASKPDRPGKDYYRIKFLVEFSLTHIFSATHEYSSELT